MAKRSAAERQRGRGAPTIDAALKCANALYEKIELELGYPERSEIKKRLKAIRHGAVTVLTAIDGRHPILDPILRGKNGALPHEFEAVVMLRELVNRISAFERRTPSRQGRGKRYSADELSARDLCALIVGLHWQMQRGHWPGQRNQVANDLCEELWCRARGDAHVMHRSEPYWRGYLKRAREFRPPHPAGESVCHILAAREGGVKKSRAPT